MAHSGQNARQSRRSLRWAGRLAGMVVGAGAACLPSSGRADAILTWNDELLSAIRQTSGLMVDGPPEVAREMAMVDTAMYDAVNAASGLPYSRYAYTGPAVANASVDAAALSAGYQVMNSIFSNPIWAHNPGGSAAIQSSVLASIGSTYNTALAALGTGSAVTAGLSLGQTAAGDMIANRATDGSGPAIITGLTPYTPPGSGTVPGVYVPPSASGGRPAMFPTWNTVKPFGIPLSTIRANEAQLPIVQQINQQGLPAFIQSAQYAKYVLQTECTGSATPLTGSIATACGAAGFAPETAAQKTAALFWNDPGTTMQPPGHWLQITDTVMTSQNLTELQEARLSALVSIAENDAGLGAWDVKYQETLWRPITAIHDCNIWNSFFTTCDPSWSSVIATPPHPDYVAGHPAFSGAAATVLELFFGTDNIAFSSISDTYCNSGTPVRNANGNITGCVVGGSTITQCNDLPTGGIQFNDSPLICPITETFGSFSDASSGLNGAEFSRVAGGIHTPFAVEDALTLGNLIGAEDFENGLHFVAEPASAMLLTPCLAALSLLRRRKVSRPGSVANRCV